MKLKKNIAISESGFVFDPQSGESFSVNPVGAEIIELIKQEKKFNEIRDFITGKYDIEAPSFEKYYYDFLNTLKQYNLVDAGEDENS